MVYRITVILLLLSGFALTLHAQKDSVRQHTLQEIRIEDLTKTAADWYTVENYLITQRMSDDWLKSGNSVVLKVPSAIIQNEFNYLLNVNHPDFSKIEIVNISRFTFDPRLKTS